ncbi:hypothetical protein [Amycolatopsis sp. NPDC051903]|uniref:hypothetical protein n=1 Tax=Amycolatopsis sp. NPDC051903 TaxID=3363936 RepID=UPI0037904F3F
MFTVVNAGRPLAFTGLNLSDRTTPPPAVIAREPVANPEGDRYNFLHTTHEVVGNSVPHRFSGIASQY